MRLSDVQLPWGAESGLMASTRRQWHTTAASAVMTSSRRMPSPES